MISFFHTVTISYTTFWKTAGAAERPNERKLYSKRPYGVDIVVSCFDASSNGTCKKAFRRSITANTLNDSRRLSRSPVSSVVLIIFDHFIYCHTIITTDSRCNAIFLQGCHYSCGHRDALQAQREATFAALSISALLELRRSQALIEEISYRVYRSLIETTSTCN